MTAVSSRSQSNFRRYDRGFPAAGFMLIKRVDLLVGDGENAIKANDVDELRGVVLRLWDNQINTAKTIGDVGRLASVLRG